MRGWRESIVLQFCLEKASISGDREGRVLAGMAIEDIRMADADMNMNLATDRH